MPFEDIVESESGETTMVEVKKEEPEKIVNFYELKNMPKRFGYKILVWGPTGSGKTHFCLTSPEPVYIFDTEQAVACLAEKFKERGVYVVPVYAINPKTFEMDSLKCIEVLEKGLVEVYHKMKEKGVSEAGTVCIDSGTSLWQYLQDWLRYTVVRVGGKINMKGVPADRRDWARANSKYSAFINSLLAMPGHAVITAQAHPVYDTTGRMTTETKASYQKNTPFLVDLVLYLYKGDDGKYYGRVEKSRLPLPGLVGTVIEDPTMPKLIKIIKQLEVDTYGKVENTAKQTVEIPKESKNTEERSTGSTGEQTKSSGTGPGSESVLSKL